MSRRNKTSVDGRTDFDEGEGGNSSVSATNGHDYTDRRRVGVGEYGERMDDMLRRITTTAYILLYQKEGWY